MAIAQPSGFAIRRNGSCNANEVDCGGTVNTFHACCPSGSFCPTQWNIDCCPSQTNCTVQLNEEPACANKTWNLVNNAGYFCCDQGTEPYADIDTGGDGCAQSGGAFPNDARSLSIIKQGINITAAASSSSSSSTSPTADPASTPGVSHSATASASNSPAPSQTNVGAIAGGVVGGCVLLVLIVGGLWTWRRRRARRADAPLLPPPAGAAAEIGYPSGRNEKSAGAMETAIYGGQLKAEADGINRVELNAFERHELGGAQNGPPIELPNNQIRYR